MSRGWSRNIETQIGGVDDHVAFVDSRVPNTNAGRQKALVSSSFRWTCVDSTPVEAHHLY